MNNTTIKEFTFDEALENSIKYYNGDDLAAKVWAFVRLLGRYS